MVRSTRSFRVLILFLASVPIVQAAEIAKYADGPFRDMGFPYSESARAGNLLFLSGQTGEDAKGKLVPGGIKAEAEQMMLNIKGALARRGLAIEHVIKCTVFLADIAEWGPFNEVYKKHFSKPYPARSAMGASGLAGNARVEMECIAAYPDQAPPPRGSTSTWTQSPQRGHWTLSTALRSNQRRPQSQRTWKIHWPTAWPRCCSTTVTPSGVRVTAGRRAVSSGSSWLVSGLTSAAGSTRSGESFADFATSLSARSAYWPPSSGAADLVTFGRLFMRAVNGNSPPPVQRPIPGLA